MSDKFDLARMLREISEEQAGPSEKNRALTQDEIKRLVAQRRKPAMVQPGAGTGQPQS